MSFLQEYTLLDELGQGGFAKVYKVRHNELGYIRAIRVLNEPVTDEKSRTYQKFLRECRVLLRLGNGTHPNIVHIYQPRLLENHALVEMDFVDGKDLLHYLNANQNFIPIDEVLRMVKEMSSALAYCHEDIYKFCMDRVEDNLQDDPYDGSKVLIDEATRQRLIEKYKVIHNDIHSGNIIRREDGSFVLLDFGLAITGADDVRNSSRHENGAMEYKAPEKWDDDTLLTEQSDIYSFGIVMYEYLAGRVPFPYDNNNSNRIKAAFALGEAHRTQMPPAIFGIRKAYFEERYPGRTYVKDYPEWLEEAIMKCLEKDPAKRFRNGQTLHEFICKHLESQNANELLAKNQSLNEEIRQLEKEKKEAEERIDMLADTNQTLRNSVAAITLENENLRSQQAQAQVVEPQPSTQPAPAPQKKKSSALPWIVAALACMALVAVLLFPKKSTDIIQPQPISNDEVTLSENPYDDIGARVFSENSYLLSGQTYHAQAMVTARQTSPTTALVSLDGNAEQVYDCDNTGIINLDFNCGVGTHTYTGVIEAPDPFTQIMQTYPFSGSFTVAPPSISVSPTKMNVVYRGIDNPIAVAGGVGGEISATATSGTLTRTSNGFYNLRPGNDNEVTINVSSNGSSLGSMKFRVKDLPKPTAIIRNVVNGQVSKSALLAAGRVEAEMKDFDFDGVHYDVLSYTFRYKTKAGTTKEAKANGSSFTEEIRNVISGANVGDMFVFTAIQVRGNDGKTKTLETPIGIEIK